MHAYVRTCQTIPDMPYQTRPDGHTHYTYQFRCLPNIHFMDFHRGIRAAEVGGIALVLIYGAAFVAALANPLTKRRQEVGWLSRGDQTGKGIYIYRYGYIFDVNPSLQRFVCSVHREGCQCTKYGI